MRVRVARSGELSRVFGLTHDLVAGVSRTRHIVACKRDPKLRSGAHFVLEDEAGEFLATLTAFRYRFPEMPTVIGLANFYVPEGLRRRGYGSRLLGGVLDHYEGEGQRVFYVLSAIGAGYYERFGFRVLPLNYEAAPECRPLFRCLAGDWRRLTAHGAYLRGLMAFVD